MNVVDVLVMLIWIPFMVVFFVFEDDPKELMKNGLIAISTILVSILAALIASLGQ